MALDLQLKFWFLNSIFQNRVDPNWTEEEKALHEQERIKQKAFKVIFSFFVTLNISSCCFQSEIVLEQLALHKPPPPGPTKYRNFPLIFAIMIMVVGLVIVVANLTENKKTYLLVKCVGPGLVMVGLTAMLLRILFTYKPTICNRFKKKKIISKAKVTNSQNRDQAW